MPRCRRMLAKMTVWMLIFVTRRLVDEYRSFLSNYTVLCNPILCTGNNLRAKQQVDSSFSISVSDPKQTHTNIEISLYM